MACAPLPHNDSMIKEVNPEEKTYDKLIFEPPLYQMRYNYVFDYLFNANPRIEKMADFGCAEGKFIPRIKKLPFLTHLYAVDSKKEVLDEYCVLNATPLPWDLLFGRFTPLEVSIIHADVTIKDPRFQGLDAVSCIELIEHMELRQLEAFTDTLFGFFRPRVVIITTPNSEFNVFFPQLEDGKFRHWDHKFEWTRSEFQSWGNHVCLRYGYKVFFDGVGIQPFNTESYGDVGFCTQIAIFERIPDLRDLCISPISPPLSQVLKTFDYPKRQSSSPFRQIEPFDWSQIVPQNTPQPEENEDVIS